jgi:uncharacterized MnhB-related membrane protein
MNNLLPNLATALLVILLFISAVMFLGRGDTSGAVIMSGIAVAMVGLRAVSAWAHKN